MPDLNLSSIPMEAHERLMRLAIEQARRNAVSPFGAVIARASDQAVMAQGVNDSTANPTLHGEIAAINDYVARRGNRGWGELVLYTTGEPCPMCMSALIWAGIGGVVYASSVHDLRQAGIEQMDLTAHDIAAAAPFWRGALLGGVLAAETDRMFAERKPGP